MKFLNVAALALLLNACGMPTGLRRSSPEASELASKHADPSSPFHSLRGWTTAIKLYAAADLTDHVVESTQRAAASWNDAVGRELISFAGRSTLARGESLYESLDDETTVLYSEKRWTKTTGKSSLTLATTIWENDGSGDQIVKGDVILNAEMYKFVDANAPDLATSSDQGIVDAESVILHELGHLIGLDHVEVDQDAESVMHAKTYIGPSFTFRVPSEADISNVRKLYP